MVLDSLTVLVTIVICIPGLIFTLFRSTWIVDYLFLVIAINRGIRRYVDYQNGYFNPFSFISLTPILIGGLATVLVLNGLNRQQLGLGPQMRKLLMCYCGLCALGFVVGFINVRFGAVYALGEFIAPIGLMGFGALANLDPQVLRRWASSISICAIIVAAYGIYQFYTIPPWDAFWVRSVGFEGYLGELKPTKMTMFSTMNERGPAAAFLASGLLVLILRPGTLGILRWPAAALVLQALLLTYVRTNLILVILSAVLFPLINRGAGIVPLVLLTLVGATAGQFVIDRMPNSEKVVERVSTLANPVETSSFKGRLVIFADALRDSVGEPFGLGIGAHGITGRISGGGSIKRGTGDSTGYVEILRTFGWAGAPVMVWFLWQIWRCSSVLLQCRLDDAETRLFRAWFLAGMVCLFSGNWLASANYFWVLAGYVIGRYDLAGERRLPSSISQ